jgi:hypothetical protein
VSETETEWERVVRAMQTLDASRHMVICEVGQKEKVETLLLRYDLAGLWTVGESKHCPAGQLLLIKMPEMFL